MSDKQKKDWGKIKEGSELMDNESLASEDGEQSSNHENSSLEHPGYTALEEALTIAEQKAHENWEKAVRAQAELENVRRRAEREIENAHRFGVEKLITSLLPVLDSLEQAQQLAKNDQNASMTEGLELTMKLFLDVLGKADVEQLDPTGATFDPQQHEAMSMQDAPDAPANTVLAVFQKGYRLNSRVIRPARVVVSKNKPVDKKV